MTNCATPAKLAYLVYEPASGSDETLSPIIFLHGLTSTKEYWGDIPQYVADGSRRKVYTIDSRNHGESEYRKEYSVKLNVVDLFHFMGTIHASKAVIVGHSMGGITAIKAALTKPERIEMIFVEDIYTKNLPGEIFDAVLGGINTLIETVKAVPTGLSESDATQFAIIELFKNDPLSMPRVKSIESLKGKMLILKKLSDGKYDVNFHKEAVLTCLMDEKRRKTEASGEFYGPACFIHGSKSPFQVGQEKNDIKKYFRKAEFFEVEGATHNIHLEFPDIFKSTVLNFLRKY